MKCYCNKIPVELKSIFSTVIHVLLRKEERRSRWKEEKMVEGREEGNEQMIHHHEGLKYQAED